MNHLYHIAFTKNILACCGLDERAAYFANLPAFLSQQHTYTDMFTHSLSHLPDMLEVTGHVFTLLEEQDQDIKKANSLLEPTLQRLKEDLKSSSNSMEYYYYSKKLFFYEQIINYHKDILDQCSQFEDNSISLFSTFYQENLEALFLSFVSYIYFDLWVTPRQLFFPNNATCSGSWALWEEVDYFKLSQWFAKHNSDSNEDLFPKEKCNDKLMGPAMIKAMIVRMGEKGSPPIQYSVIDWNIRIFFRFLGIKGYKRFDSEMEYLLHHETGIQEILRSKFEKP